MINSEVDLPKIRNMRPDELALALEWAAREGWNPGLGDAKCFYAADPTGFFVAVINNEPVGCISAVAYGDFFGFLGLYIVLPEYRGKGYGMMLWNAAMEYMDGRNIGLDGVVAQQKNYGKSGFKLAHSNVRYELKPDGRAAAVSALAGDLKNVNTDKSSRIASLSDFPASLIIEYDAECFGVDRADFIEGWINQPGAIAIGAIESDRLIGYGLCRPSNSGSKIGPLFASSDNVAQIILLELLQQCPTQGPVYLDVPEANRRAVDLAEKCGMIPMFETARMYNVRDPALPIDKIYGITTFELG